MNLTGGHLIDGGWSQSEGKFSHHNPATGAALTPEVSEAGEAQVQAAVESARVAFDATRHLEMRWPARLLDAIAGQILKLGDTLIERANQETALPTARLLGERARTVNQLKMFADLIREGAWLDARIDTADPNRQPIPKPDLRRIRVPRGPVAVFGASNFPFAFSAVGGDTASALAAGCPVIVKGHPSHPGASELFAIAVLAALAETDLPRGLFQLLQGRSHELGKSLVQNAGITAVGFTGSKKAGRALFDLAAARRNPIPVYAEMGSLNPLLLLPAALSERGAAIAKDLAASILLGGGQQCTKPGLILVFRPCDDFLGALTSYLKQSPPLTMLNQSLRDGFSARTAAWAKRAGVTVLLRGESSGYASVSPSLLRTSAEEFVNHEELREEAFGPAALVLDCADVSDARRVLASVGGSLTGTIHAGSTDDVRPLLAELEHIAGRIIFNGYPTGVEVCGAMMHGGPYPATTDPSWTSVGPTAITRFLRLVSYQNAPDEMLPLALRKSHPMGIVRTINGQRTTESP